ncbi:hypothetical protein Dimus_026070 [Dionaea muscipula]
MAGFFSLAGGGGGNTSSITGREGTTSSQHPQPPPQQNPAVVGGNEIINPWGNPSVVLYRNEEIYQKGFEIWQQYVQVHHHHHAAAAAASTPKLLPHHHPDAAVYQLGDPSGGSGSGVGGSSRSLAYSTSSRGMRSGGGALVGGINCQDCGNQAKKDCAHLRCRTCCKSRGFDCPTHVKSTWVPAAKRRERQQHLAVVHQQHQQNSNQQPQQHQQELLRGGGAGAEKRLRDNRSINVLPLPLTRLATTTTAATTTSAAAAGLEVGHNFPVEVSSPALFRCVRVSSIDDAEEHLAYQTAVTIAGHVFKGILYDQGPESRYNPGGAAGGGDDEESPRGSSGLQQHNLLSGIGAVTADESGAGGSQQQLLDPPASSSIYPTPINAFLAGTQFFPPPRS